MVNPCNCDKYSEHSGTTLMIFFGYTLSIFFIKVLDEQSYMILILKLSGNAWTKMLMKSKSLLEL